MTVITPRRATVGSAGYDFYSPATCDLEPNKWVDIDTGVRLDDADVCAEFSRWFMMLVPRSGLSNRYGFRLRNTVGIIDMDYRDTIKAKVTVDIPMTLSEGERFLQGVIIPYGTFGNEIVPIDVRKGGFGSTGGF